MTENEVSKGAKHVTVACKVPNGLRLRIFKSHVEVQSDRNGNTRDVTVNYPVGEPFVINGPKPLSAQPGFPMPGGYALTHNVPADLFSAWMDANKESLLVKNKLIYCASSAEAATKQAQEQEEIKSNLEPLDTSTSIVKGREVNLDPRWPKSVPGSGVSDIVTGTRAA